MKVIERERVIQTIFDAIDELNQQLSAEQKVEKSLDTVLFGRSGQLDSLGLVNLIVLTEQNIEVEFGVPINLADEKAMSQKDSPFKTIEKLADYITLLLEENSHG